MGRRRRYSLFTKRYVTRALTGGLLRLRLDKNASRSTIAFRHSPVSFQLIAFNDNVSIAPRENFSDRLSIFFSVKPRCFSQVFRVRRRRQDGRTTQAEGGEIDVQGRQSFFKPLV